MAVFAGGETMAQQPGFQVRVVAADGAGGRAIGGMAVAFGPAWSPGGDRIAFIGVGLLSGTKSCHRIQRLLAFVQTHLRF